MSAEQMSSINRGAAAAGAVLLAAVALAGCAGEPSTGPGDSPMKTDQPPASASDAPTSAPGVGTPVGEVPDPAGRDDPGSMTMNTATNDEGSLIGASGSGWGAGSINADRTTLPGGVETLELAVYCTPAGEPMSVDINAVEHPLTCGGAEDGQIIEIDVREVRDHGSLTVGTAPDNPSVRVSWTLTPLPG